MNPLGLRTISSRIINSQTRRLSSSCISAASSSPHWRSYQRNATSKALQSLKARPPLARHFTSTGTCSARYVRFSGQIEPQPENDQPRKEDPKKSGWELRDYYPQIGVGLVVIGTVHYVSHLEQVEETGRWRFMDVSKASEAEMSRATHAELLETYGDKMLPSNHPLTKYVKRVVTRILEANNLGVVAPEGEQLELPPGMSTDDFPWSSGSRVDENAAGAGTTEWKVMVVQDPKVVNAMAAYGNIIVFTGLLPVCKDEEGLAAILGHEIGHVVCRHSSERQSLMTVLFGVGLLVEGALYMMGIDDFGLRRLATTYLLDLPNSRTQEYEADTIGLRLIAKACYDPIAPSEMMTRLGEAAGERAGRNFDFLTTHPASNTRAKRLQEMVAEAHAIQAENAECNSVRENFQSFKELFGFGGAPDSKQAPPEREAQWS